MSLLYVIIVLIIVGLALWIVNTYVPLDQKIKKILNWVVVIFVIIWLLRALGAFAYIENVRL